MARNSADLALLLSAMAGPDPRCPISIPQPGSVFADHLRRDFKGVRIAWYRDLGGIPIDRRIRAVMEPRRKALEDLGCVVEEAEPDFTGVDEAFKTLRAFTFAAGFSELMNTRRSDFKDTIQWEVDRGAKLTALDIARAEALHSAYWLRFQEFLTRYEFFVLPVTQVPAFDIGMPFVDEIEGVRMETYIDWMRSCYYISLAGNPAVSVPAGFTPEGLPVGLQIVSRDAQELSLLQLTSALENTVGVGTGNYSF